MGDVQGDVLGPQHGTTPTTVIANIKKNYDPLRAVNILTRKGHTMVSATEASSVTLQNWQRGAKMNDSNFANFNRIVHTRNSIIQKGPNIINEG